MLSQSHLHRMWLVLGLRMVFALAGVFCFQFGVFTSTYATFNSKRKFTRMELDSYDIGHLDWKASLALLAESPNVVNDDSRRYFASMDILVLTIFPLLV